MCSLNVRILNHETYMNTVMSLLEAPGVKTLLRAFLFRVICAS